MRLVPALLGLAIGLAAAGPVRAETEVPPPPKPWLGIGFDDENGIAYVRDVHPGTGASAAGILPNDIIVAIDGVPLTTGIHLPQLVSERKIGQRIAISLLRMSPEYGYGEPIIVTARLSAMPTTEELVYRRLFDRALPALSMFDRHGAAVPVAEWTRRPQVWMVFSVRCDACAASAASLRAQLLDADNGAGDAPLRTVVIGRSEELSSYVARVPLLGTVWRMDPGDDERRNMIRFFLSGIPDSQNDGVVLVVDHRGIVRFATAISAGESAHDGACAAAARALRAWRP